MSENVRAVCPRCETLMPSDHRYCHKCGAWLRNARHVKFLDIDKGSSRSTSTTTPSKEDTEKFTELVGAYHALFLGDEGDLDRLLPRIAELERQIGKEAAEQARTEANFRTGLMDSLLF